MADDNSEIVYGRLDPWICHVSLVIYHLSFSRELTPLPRPCIHLPLNRPRDTVSRRNSRLPGSHSLIATGIPVTVPRRSQWRELSVSASRVPSDRARRPWSTAFAAASRAAAAWPL